MPPSSDVVWELYSPARFPNNDWGKPYWFTLEFMSANLPTDLTQQQFTQWVSFVLGFNQGLPCVICRDHMTQFLAVHRLNSPQQRPFYLKGINNWRFVTMFHNAVNQRLGKPLWEEDDIERLRQTLVIPPGMHSGSQLCHL
jgi:hypothetical protein